MHVRVDEGTNDWNVPERQCSEIKLLRAEITLDICYKPDEKAVNDNPELGFDGHRIFGNDSFPSLAEEFPAVVSLEINIDCSDDPIKMPKEGVKMDYVRGLLRKKILEPLLSGGLEWEHKVEVRTVLTYPSKGNISGKEAEDISEKQAHQKEYSICNSSGEVFFIGSLEGSTNAS